MARKSKYINCDIYFFQLGKGQYQVLFNSDIGASAQDTFKLPFRPTYLNSFFGSLNRTLRSSRAHMSQKTVQTLQTSITDFGRRLFNAVFIRYIFVSYDRCVNLCKKGDRVVRLRIHTEGAAKLRDLPWEHLNQQNIQKPLALTSSFSIVRYPDLPLPLVRQNVRLPIKILVAISAPVDAPRLNVRQEMKKLKEALKELENERLVDVEYISNCTLEKLRAKLVQPKTTYHIVHFIGHGGFSETKQEGVIYLEDNQSRAAEVTGADLAPMFLSNNVSLVFLNMCETARPSITNPFAAPAEFLVKRGIPCVIGMQFPISDDAAITFSSVFYRELASGATLDDCVQKGRQQIEQSTTVPEWGTPVLFMRTAQDRLFQLAQPARTRKKGAKTKGKIVDPTDPYKGFANRKSKDNYRSITATIEKEKGYEGYHYVTLKVESTDPEERPLKGKVIFHLHPSFQFPKRIVKVVDGVATLDITAYGAFTVGAEADDGKTKLELDLMKVPGATKLFYES